MTNTISNPSAHLCIMVMGPSGVGKTSIAVGIAEAIGGIFIEGDDYHPPENRAAMSAGHPLTDEMRWPWLEALSIAVRDSIQTQRVVFACSALKRSYRDLLRDRIGGMDLVYLHAPAELILERMRARTHFMPPSLLQSQLDTLEVPTPDEQPITLDMTLSIDEAVQQGLDVLSDRHTL